MHEEACRWEHVMSDKVEKRILEMLKDPKFSPYGNAIPGLEDLGHSSEKNDERTVPHVPGGTRLRSRGPFHYFSLPRVHSD